MQIPNAPVSLADLSAAGIRLDPEAAATLVRELALQVERGEVAGVPSAHVIRLSSTGSISVEGPVAAGGRSVERAAQLLDALLTASDSGSEHRVPGALKLVLARGLGTLDLPPFASLAAFAEALSRFVAPDPAAIVERLVTRCAEAVAARPDEPPRHGTESLAPHIARVEPFAPVEGAPQRASVPPGSLTISDIRRARRATGMSLTQVAERSRIPLGLLRQLEWGYLLNWPARPRASVHLTRYARACGLDEQLVVATVLPVLEQTTTLRALFARHGSRVQSVELSPGAGAEIGEIILAGREARQAEPARGSRARGLLAVPALLALALLPVWWAHSTGHLDVLRTADRSVDVDDATGDGSWAPAEDAAPPRRTQVTSGAEPPPATPEDPGAEGVVPSAARSPLAGAAVPPPAQIAESAASAPAASAPAASAPGATRAAASSPPAGPAYSPPPSAGTAMFHQAGPDEAVTAIPASSPGAPGSVLRVTRIVGDSANNSPIRPSPDGGRIAFDSDRDGERGVYVAEADGRNVRRVSPPGFAAMPSWSPDGRALAFVRAEADRLDVWNLWILEVETGALRQVTRHAEGQPWGGSWFPDGRRIAYALADRLVIHDLDSGRNRVFASPRKGRLMRTPVVSPDGQQVVFHVSRDGTWLLHMADGSMRRVLDDPTANEYAWSPDGKQLAYHSARSGGWHLWVVAPR